MKPALILLAILVVGGAIVWLIDQLFYHRNEPEKADETEDFTASQGCTDESCGIRSICPSEQILAGECRQEVTYYDDEELDAFAGRGEDGYTDQEMEQWRDVLYTLKHDELLPWERSIKKRAYSFPMSLKRN